MSRHASNSFDYFPGNSLMARQKRGGDEGTTERRYEHPIPSREEISARMEKVGSPLTLKALANTFGIRADAHQRALENRLRAMVRDGQLIRNRALEYCLTQHLDLIVGKVQAHRDGYGFLRPDEGGEDIYISAREMRALWDGDRIAVRVSAGRRGGREGTLVEILERGTTAIVGRFYREKGVDYVVPVGDGQSEVLIGRGGSAQAKPGDIVRVEITQHPTARTNAIGSVASVLGHAEEAGIDTQIAIFSHGLPHEWSAAVEAAAHEFPETVPASAARGRTDLREMPLVTIDGADAKDFDDAVYCEPQRGGWKLIVAIADVAHYVVPGTALDNEARARGTSVYFPDRVIPMLPEVLSNGLCSLRPDVDRLCLCCEMHVSPRGEVTASRFFEGIMRSAARLTYEESWKLLEDAGFGSRHAHLRGALEHLRDVYAALAEARKRRGAIDFDLPETEIELDARGQVRNVHPVERLLTHRLIEECMVAANVETAKRLRKARIPGLYRVHDPPAVDRIEELTLFLKPFGLKLSAPTKITPRDLSRLIEKVHGRPEAELIETVALRSMSQARYQAKNGGHFGLALDAYSHFTSPIRRYPDLLAHRAIKWLLQMGAAKGFHYTLPEMEQLGERCSLTERRGDEAVWEVEERLKCRYLQAHLGETFSVRVSSVVAFGLFVRIPGLAIDGLVHVSSLPKDYYHRDASGTTLTGEHTGKSYRLTDVLEAKLVAVDVENGKIDFMPLEGAPRAAERPRSKRRRG
jgi:ribonuclease R